MRQDLVEKLALLLEAKKKTLATAESCTGGLLAATITQRPGASKSFERGFVTYSNESKIELLDVSKAILESHGAVSSETACAMAKGVIKNSHADVAISITGIAGPEGDENKPVGLVFFGYAVRGIKEGVEEHHFKGERMEIQRQSVATALQILVKVLDDMP